METDEPDVGAKQDPPASNVVRFPRDWIGPLDELVPFGPSAGQASDQEQAPEPEARVDDLSKNVPLRPDDFWGEDSAAIHHPLEAPQDERRAIERPGFPEVSAVGRELRHAWLRRSRRLGDAQLRRVGVVFPRRIGYRSSSNHVQLPRPRRRPAWVGAAVIAVSAGAIVAVSALNEGNTNRHATRPPAVQRYSAGLPAVISDMSQLDRRHPPATLHAAHVPRQPHRPPGRPVRSTSVGAARYVRAATPVSSSAATVYAPIRGRASSGSTETFSSSHATSAQPPPPRTSSSGTTSTTASSRPTFGANGLLGPGSSPDS